MRLAIDIPESWKQQAFGPRLRAEIEHGLELEVAPLAELPEDVRAWARGVPLRDLSGGVSSAVITASSEDKSDLEWTMIVHESNGLDANGTRVQSRIHVLYIFVEHCAMIAFRATDDAKLSTRRAELLAIARTARPDWGVPVGASLEDLLAT
ncbi:MAG: hypothetical protein AB7L94_37440 [Kofleriaceae bacterium]